MPASTTDSSLPRLAFRLPLDPARLLRARQRIRDYLYERCLSGDDINTVVLAIEEAMTNAVRHSGASDDLEVDLHLEGRDLVAEVRDHGCGFDVDAFDAAEVPDLLEAGGRGLFLIAKLMDELQLRRDGGLEVRAVKRKALSEAPSSGEGARTTFRLPGDPSYLSTRQQVLLDDVEEMVSALDWEYRYVFVNKAAVAFAGRGAKAILGRSFWEFLPPLEGTPQGRAIRAAMELGSFSIIEHRSVATGDWFETRVYPTTTGVTIFSRQINARKIVEIGLQTSEERFRLLFESMIDGYAFCRMLYDEGRPTDFVYLDVNAAFERLTGLHMSSR